MIPKDIIAQWTCMRLPLLFNSAATHRIAPAPRIVRSPRARAASIATVLLVLEAMSGCVYRVNIQQGNFLEARTVNQLQDGMTRSQVRYLLGTPMVPDAFDKDRWDYLYYFKKGRWRRPEERRLTVFFKEDKVERFDRINIPEKAPQGPDQGPSVSKFPVM
jgi:outer membrane protein assembly factor BamE